MVKKTSCIIRRGPQPKKLNTESWVKGRQATGTRHVKETPPDLRLVENVLEDSHGNFGLYLHITVWPHLSQTVVKEVTLWGPNKTEGKSTSLDLMEVPRFHYGTLPSLFQLKNTSCRTSYTDRAVLTTWYGKGGGGNATPYTGCPKKYALLECWWSHGAQA